MVIAVDIDGILTVETEGWGDSVYRARTPRLDNIQKINRLYQEGHLIILHSARHLEDEPVTVRWLREHKVKYHRLILGKLHYDIAIDDRAICHVEELVNYNFHHSCWRFTNRHPPRRWEVHPCFFCGQGIQIGTNECPTCGIMICPVCHNCLCTVPALTRLTLFRIHAKYCCDLPNFSGKIELDGFVDNDVIKRCETALRDCRRICFGEESSC